MIVHCKHKVPFDVYVGRPTKWGNPFASKPSKIAQFRTASVKESLDLFEKGLRECPDMVAMAKAELAGKTLACWCAPKGGVGIDDNLICHAQLLARAARGDYD
jgi:hypothetical protein